MRETTLPIKTQIMAAAIGADEARRLGHTPWRPEVTKNCRRVMFVYTWSRDCDMCEGDGIEVIPATTRAFRAFYDAQMYNAEGPCHVYPITVKEAAEFTASFRDRVLEAYEEGEYYNV